MKFFKILRLIICSVIAVLSLAAFIVRDTLPVKLNLRNMNGNGFAVLELFTSEGCSSCPPADDLMAKIQHETKGNDIYILAYHVDYWDRDGWKDMYSSADFSNRQIEYGHWLHVSPIYTPQVIVNGKAEFVGSAESAIRGAISGQLAITPVAVLEIQAHQNNEGLNIQYQATTTVKGSHLLIAILQKSAQSKVTRGENAGHTLSHVQIVRKLQNEPLSISGNGSRLITLPKDFNAKNWEILGLVQDQSNGEILAVAKVGLDDGLNEKK